MMGRSACGVRTEDARGPRQLSDQCGNRFPWTVEAEASGTPGQTVHAPSGVTGEFTRSAKKALVQLSPAVEKLVTDVATKALTTEATSLLDKHKF
jgi:hypothetical protein